MINAEHAEKIMSLYESDYDDFVKGLKKKANSKKTEAAKATNSVKAAVATASDKKAQAAEADQNAKEAELHKPTHLKEKAAGLLAKAGGIQGIASTIGNVAKYFKTTAPSDYSVNVGEDKTGDKPKEKIPEVVWYAGGAVALLAIIYACVQMSKPRTPQLSPTIVPPAH